MENHDGVKELAMKNIAGLCVITVGSLLSVGTSALRAQTLLSVADGFGSTSFSSWSSVLSPEAQTGTFLSTGGNPGTYASLIATTSVNNRIGTGFQYRGVGSAIILGNSGGQITLGADVRRTSVVSAGTPVPEVVPIIIQNNRLYQPTSFIPGPTNNEWTTIAPVTFNFSEFSNSSGVPLNFTASVTVGFWIRQSAAPTVPSGAAYGVGIDNVTITVIPAPTAAGFAVIATLGASIVRRRR